MTKIRNELITLDWDTDFFGVKSGKVLLRSTLSEDEKFKLLEFIDSNQFTTIVNKEGNHHNDQWIGEFTSAYLIDTNVQFSKTISDQKFDNINQINQIKYISVKNDQKKSKRIMNIAKKSFNLSRFYSDPKIDNSLANKLYENWVENSFNKKEKYFITYTLNDEIVGFLLFVVKRETAIIELIAVDEVARGIGIGKQLLLYLDLFLNENNINNVQVGTQIGNIPAIRFYLDNSFIIETTSSIYHLWNQKKVIRED